jgi:hypothetical protein
MCRFHAASEGCTCFRCVLRRSICPPLLHLPGLLADVLSEHKRKKEVENICLASCKNLVPKRLVFVRNESLDSEATCFVAGTSSDRDV